MMIIGGWNLNFGGGRLATPSPRLPRVLHYCANRTLLISTLALNPYKADQRPEALSVADEA